MVRITIDLFKTLKWMLTPNAMPMQMQLPVAVQLQTRQTLWVIFCRLSEKGRKEIVEIVEKMKKGTGKKEEQEQKK